MRQVPRKKPTRYKTNCIGQCQRLKGYCTGCGRTNEEIFDWVILTKEQQQAILVMPRTDT